MSREVPQIFDRLRLRQNRMRRAAKMADYDFLLRRAAEDLAGRIALQNRRFDTCLLYTSPSPRDRSLSRMPSSA